MQPRTMNEQSRIDVEALMDEIARYLAAIDAYRAERCEPTWLPEPQRVDG